MKRFLNILLSKERRRAARRVISGLVVYYWDGGQPIPRPVKDISLTGLYILTQNHWYPGTIVQLTLQETDKLIVPSDRCIKIQAKVVRQGSDGVGVAFLPGKARGVDQLGKRAPS